jgi:hypothetical protein
MQKSELTEAKEIAGRMMTELLLFPVTSNVDAAKLRTAVGRFMVDFGTLVDNKVIGTELFACFEQARTAGAALNTMDRVRLSLFAEAPLYNLGLVIVNAGILFSFIEQSQVISVMEFTSRSEVDELMDAMNVIIDDIKLNKADSFTSSDYQSFVLLAALLIQHMSATERQLPRVLQYHWAVNYPALTLSNRIYGDGSRSDELIAENNTVHPAFMQRDIVALSS